MSAKLIVEFNSLRTARTHLECQVEAGVETSRATLAEARETLAEVDARLKELEPGVRALPDAAYLFGGKPRRKSSRIVKPAGRTPVPPPQSQATSNTTPKEGTQMAKQSKAAKLEETLVALRKAEKSAGTTKWALEGAGAKKNPPTPERAKALKAKLKKEQALVKELRATRDELKAAA